MLIASCEAARGSVLRNSVPLGITTDIREVTMKITVNAPKDSAAEYLRLIADQLEDDFTSGHYDADTNWQSENDEWDIEQ